MKSNIFQRAKSGIFQKTLLSVVVCVQFLFVGNGLAQTKTNSGQKTGEKITPPAKSVVPPVTQIDAPMLKTLLKREGENTKPLLVNFWATWCDPCREEFPELVEVDADYGEKIDFITISLDDLAEINGDVPKFLTEMKAEMPTYLLKTDDEEAAIISVAKDWNGGLPFTILFDGKGAIAYTRMGKVKPDVLRVEIDKLLP